jgi:hypothetical protein
LEFPSVLRVVSIPAESAASIVDPPANCGQRNGNGRNRSHRAAVGHILIHLRRGTTPTPQAGLATLAVDRTTKADNIRRRDVLNRPLPQYNLIDLAEEICRSQEIAPSQDRACQSSVSSPSGPVRGPQPHHTFKHAKPPFDCENCSTNLIRFPHSKGTLHRVNQSLEQITEPVGCDSPPCQWLIPIFARVLRT